MKGLRALLGIEKKLEPNIDSECEQNHLAVTSLFVEVAMVDNDFDVEEQSKILKLIESIFSLNQEKAKELLNRAEKEVKDSTQLFPMTTRIKKTFSYEQRVELVESLWQVVYADGKMDAYEDQLMRRIGDLISVSDRDRTLARKRSLANNQNIKSFN
tara:strand:+ start:207 stop:677 length:471 start_codon:yes stop_codon:yes gene_type:complete